MLASSSSRTSCHSRAGGNPAFLSFSGLPPEFTPAKAEAGVTNCLSSPGRCRRMNFEDIHREIRDQHGN
jgi:hypothetical protein